MVEAVGERKKNHAVLCKTLVAMVMVAAVALSSATYAWFVSNNSVEATTTTISAQSNSPFLQIRAEATAVDSTSGTAASATGSNTALYPAQAVSKGGAPIFQSAYAAAKGASTMLTDSRFDAATLENAVTNSYAIKNSFAIGTSDAKAGSFKDLVITDVTATDGGLNNAICVLAKCGNNWYVWNKDGKVTAYADRTSTGATSTVLADSISADSSVVVDLYVFYDGSESGVYTDVIDNLTATGVTVTFSATAVSTNGQETGGTNNVNYF